MNDVEQMRMNIDLVRGLAEKFNNDFTNKAGVPAHNMFLLEDKGIVSEGMYASYPPETVKKHLMKRFRLSSEQIEIASDENGKDTTILVVIPKTDENKKLMDQAMSMCGYFPSMDEDYYGYLKIQYEKRIQDSANYIVRRCDYLYHITPSVYVPKIMEIGLCPKTKNKYFNYPERIFFYTRPLPEYTARFFAADLYQYIPQTDFTKQNKVYDEYSVLKIDISKLNLDDMDFHEDPNLQGGVFTQSNIHPDAISVYMKGIKVK